MDLKTPHKDAVIGAGIAGAGCAHTLTLAGHAVHVLDKSNGPGGRLASRRAEWLDRRGQARMTRLDHGPGERQACTAPGALEAAHQTVQRLFA